MSRIQSDPVSADAPQPIQRTGTFDPTQRLEHNQVCALKASNALHRDSWLWSGSGGGFAEVGVSRHAARKP